ncbi:MAG: prepilin-type N-terminal cleavage/methylation domain-containing protein [Burkholderiales bacterium]|nr:prepilin-type N-terminal cleavage/methylation domain-containing protein [Burkholderiales bacterium]
MRSRLFRSRGVSLIEALVALAVMGFGMLGIVALQMSLRSNSDHSRQQAEAVRIASDYLERSRAYSVIASDPSGTKRAYEDIVDDGTFTVTGINATYAREVEVDDSDDLTYKSVRVRVTWDDRAGVQQRIELSSVIHRTPPELAGSLVLPAQGTAVSALGGNGRHWSIPAAAVDIAGNQSEFTPPGGGSVRWIFDRASGMIVQHCVPGPCVNISGRLLHGFITFATASTQPTAMDAEAPSSAALAGISVSLNQSAPTGAAPPQCFVDALSATTLEYFCLVRVTMPSGSNSRWSGRSLLAGLPLAASAGDASASAFRVCRYTPVQGCDPAVGDTIWGHAGATASCTGTAPTPERRMTNSDHPRDYDAVAESLVNQNFLVIRAGDGTTAFSCPQDDVSTPFINGNTRLHQP